MANVNKANVSDTEPVAGQSEMKQWRESQDRLSQTLLAKLSDSADRGVTASHGNSEESTTRRTNRSTETSLARQNIANSADCPVREESTLTRKSPPSRRKGKDSPSVSVSGVTTRQPGGGEEKPSPEQEVEGSCCHLCAGDPPREKSSRVLRRRHHSME
jgi:hypothetical protein